MFLQNQKKKNFNLFFIFKNCFYKQLAKHLYSYKTLKNCFLFFNFKNVFRKHAKTNPRIWKQIVFKIKFKKKKNKHHLSSIAIKQKYFGCNCKWVYKPKQCQKTIPCIEMYTYLSPTLKLYLPFFYPFFLLLFFAWLKILIGSKQVIILSIFSAKVILNTQ